MRSCGCGLTGDLCVDQEGDACRDQCQQRVVVAERDLGLAVLKKIVGYGSCSLCISQRDDSFFK
jgi:hypothetical protein